MESKKLRRWTEEKVNKKSLYILSTNLSLSKRSRNWIWDIYVYVLIYINDFVNASSILDFHLFADDSNLFYSHRDLDHLEQSVNQELKKINTWLCVNKLSLNIAKSHFVIFRPYQKKVNSQIKFEIEGKLINECKSVKYLGVLLDCNLNWKEHIQQITKKVSRGIGVICKMRYFVETKVMLLFCHSFLTAAWFGVIHILVI